MPGNLHVKSNPKKSEVENIQKRNVPKKPPGFRQKIGDIEIPHKLSIEGYARLLQDADSESRRSEYTQQLQQTLGNTYVQKIIDYINTKNNDRTTKNTSSAPTNIVSAKRVLQRVISEVSTEEGDHFERSTEVPALTERTLSSAKQSIEEGREQEAINIIVGEIGAVQMPNLAYCVPPKPTYKTDLELDGICRFQYDPVSNRALRIWVDVGDRAFRSLSFLYSTMMHEYQHVNQAIEDPKDTKENTPMSEFAAYTWEIIHAWETGTRINPDELKEIGTLLYDLGWSQMTEEEQGANLIPYRNAIGFIRGFTGDETWEPS